MSKLTAIVRTSKGVRRFPAYAIRGQWAITDPSILSKPKADFSWVVVTHQPTGYRAKDIKRGSDYERVLRRFDELFGKAITVRGVMRKFSKLSKTDKRWVTKPI